jgi:4-amino-4-deoxy-L-arabinose transferase-like glycosyltransferase
MTRGVGESKPGPARPKIWRLLFLLALALYLGAALYQLDLPGLNYDEAVDAVPAMQKVQGQRVDSFSVLDTAGQQWPLMTVSFVGVTSTYPLMPVFAWLGISVTTLRGTAVLLALISLLLVWGFLRELFDERVAALTVLLLAVSSSFVFWSRMGAWVALPLLPITTLTLWMLFRWYGRRRAGYLVAACFGLGLGLATHIKFLWVWIGLVLAWLLLSPWLGAGRGWRRWLWPWQIAGVRAWVLGIAAVLLGSTPILLYNLLNRGTFQYAMGMVATGELGRLPDLEFVKGILTRGLEALQTLLTGDWFGGKLGGPYRDPLAVPALAIGLGVILWLTIRRRLAYSVKRVALLVILLVSIVFLSAVISISESAYHLLMVSPIPPALISVAAFRLVDLTALFGRRRAVWLGFLGIVVICLVGSGLWTTWRYHVTLSRTGGEGLFSDAIYTLATDLDQPGAPQPIALDWGFRRNLELLTQNRVDPPEWYTYSSPPGPEFEGYVHDLITRLPGAVYLFHTPRWTVFPGHQETFEEVAYRQRLVPVLWKTYYQRDGEPVYLAYTLKPAPHLFTPPPTSHPLNVRLGDGLALLGYDLPQDRIRPGGEIDLTLYWQALSPQARSYKVFVHLLDDNGKLWSQHDSPPVAGGYPTTDWQAGEIVPDRIRLKAPDDLPAGTYHLFTGMYDETTGERLPLYLEGQRLKGDTLGLEPVMRFEP